MYLSIPLLWFGEHEIVNALSVGTFSWIEIDQMLQILVEQLG